MNLSKLNEKKSFTYGSFEIRGNCVILGNTIIQISNISKVWIGQIPPKYTYLIIGIILLLMGIGFFSLFIPLAIIICILGGGLIYLHVKTVKHESTFNLQLSSGDIFSIIVKSEKQDEICAQAKEIMIDCFNDVIGTNYIEMNLQAGKIDFKHNETNTYNDNRTFINYTLLSDELPKIIEALIQRNADPNDINTLKEILADAEKKDENGIKNKLKKLSSATCSLIKDLAVGTASNYLMTLLGI